jgi:PEP-CTERM motif
MRRVLLLVLLALALPTMTWASSSIDFTNSGGTLSGSSSGLSLAGSTLIAVKGLNGGGLITGNLGTLSLSTGALVSGSLMTGATFAAGGSFIISGNGTNGIPNGVIFSGTFSSSSPVTWNVITLADGSHQYTLTGAIEGNGKVGATVQLAVISGKGLFSGTADLSSGDTSLSAPEPGTLGLLGTGLLGIGGLMRRRLRIG